MVSFEQLQETITKNYVNKLSFYANNKYLGILVNNKNFLDKYGVDHTGAIMTRFFGAIFIGSTLMAIEILLVGTEGAWPFFVLIFLQNLSAFFIGIYSIKINKLGVNEKTTIEGIIAPGILTILSTILIYGLSDKIYI